MDDKIKAHPDYEDAYTDALNGRNPPGKRSVPYEAGWAAGSFAREAFRKAGFEQEGEDTFTLTMKLGE